MDVDVIILSRDASPLRADVRTGVMTQAAVRPVVHRVIAPPRPEDPNRWATIARARNEGKRLGRTPWLLFVDDDVVLGGGCVARLMEGLLARLDFAALGADCAGEMSAGWGNWDCPRHVGMAATLFRRERLAGLTFRWEPSKCECRCCCEDLRRAGFGIGYLPGATAWHRPLGMPRECAPVTARTKPIPGRVLAAFDRRHVSLFRRLFLETLRASGNPEPVTAVAYGLYPSEHRLLARLPGVEVVARPANGGRPAVRRLRDFQAVLARWPERTPVAFWDAGDVLFQARIAPLWDEVRTHPEAILAVREPRGYPENEAITDWTRPIRDPHARRRAFELFSTHPFLNGGFAAGTADSMQRFLAEADRLLRSTELLGTTGDDQSALNFYCHTNPQAWREVPQGWNYCLAGRKLRDYQIHPGGRTESRDGSPVHVVHGNARTLPWVGLLWNPGPQPRGG